MTNDLGRKDKDAADYENYDIFRDSALRYLGYANEVGESFRYQFPKLLIPSYAVAFGYCFADAATSGHAAFDAAKRKGSPTATVDSLVSAVDTLVWQSLASVVSKVFISSCEIQMETKNMWSHLGFAHSFLTRQYPVLQ